MRDRKRQRRFECLETRCLLAGDLVGLQINEIVAVNQSTLETRVREEADDRYRGAMLTPDWIELYNDSDVALDLSGASLTDDPKHFDRWYFPPETTIASGQHLVVFASGVDVQNTELDESGILHAHLKFDAGGEYIAVLDSDGEVVDFVDTYPRLVSDLAFGRDATGFSLLTSPTPGATNSAHFEGQVAGTEVNVNRGFYSQPFTVSVSTATAGAEIRYTIDGSEPTRTHGTVYTAPIALSTTTNLRTAAFKEGFVPTDVDTQTYIFVSEVVNQPAEIEGFPSGGRVWAGENTYVPQDTEMDPEIVGDPAYADIIDDSLLAIPTLSITSDQGQIFGNTGWYDGENVEAAVSVELLYPDDAQSNQQINAGIESHSHERLKRSLRLNFREEYGDSVFKTDFFQRSPVTGDSATDQFNAIILRGGNNRSWARVWNPDKTAYAIDEFYRSSQVAMSGYGMRGQVAHLYINGVYWGLYNPVERADQEFGSEYFGGAAEDWFTLNHGGDLAGNDDRWDRLRRLGREDMTVEENYEELEEHLDLDAFIDYLIIAWWTAVSDWPQNNYYGTNRNESSNLDANPFRFVAWDGEWSWGQGGQSSSDGRAHVHASFRANRSGGEPIPLLWHAARANPDFMSRFHDRVYHHLYGDGALTEVNATARWTALTDVVREAVVAESARWGDSLEEAGRPTRTRDGDWQREVDRIAGLIDGNNESFLSALRREGFYPDIDPPTMLLDGVETAGEKVLAGASIAFSGDDESGVMYVGLDGVDPRLPDGSLAPAAIEIVVGGSVTIERTTSVTVRKRDGEAWSAANRATFTTAGGAELDFSEFDFNPAEPSPDEVAAGLTNNDMFEFLELTNSSNHAIDLDGFRFNDGIDFEFGRTVMMPGETAVLARNGKALRARYGDSIRVLGEFSTTGLSNGGEKISLIDPSGDVVFEVKYDDQSPWPGADGDGNSLHRVSASASASEASNWRAATPTPGETATQDPDLNGDGSIDARDVDHLCAAIAADELSFDLNQDGAVNPRDVDFFVVDLLQTVPGDANLDRTFNSADLVTIFRAGEYEDAIEDNSGWAEGDWNCDGDFNSSDFVHAFRNGGYVATAMRRNR